MRGGPCAPFSFVVYCFKPGLPVHHTDPADDIPIDALILYVRTI
jgi:hypothetical protein